MLLEITIALIGALKVYLLCNLGNYCRPTNQQTDLRVHREVTLQITIILWFKKKCIFIISDRILSIVIIPLIFRQQIFSQKRINFCWEPYISFYVMFLWMHLWIWLENVEIIVIRLLWKTFFLSFSEFKVLNLTVDFVNILTVIKFWVWNNVLIYAYW